MTGVEQVLVEPVSLQKAYQSGEKQIDTDGTIIYDEFLAELALESKGYAGHYLNENGDLVIKIANEVSPNAVKNALTERIDQLDGIDAEVVSSAQIEHASYDFLQLFSWKRDLQDAIAKIEKVNMTDINEQINKLIYGLEDLSASDQVLEIAESAGVPRDAIKLRQSDPLGLDATLESELDEARGGFYVEYSGGSCTQGPLANHGGTDGYLYNSHCSSTTWEVDGNTLYNNDYNHADEEVGIEQVDPGTWTSSECPSGYRCAHADAMWGFRSGDKFYEFGTVYRTTDRGRSYGSTTIDGYFRITVEGSYPSPGTEVNKMGYYTGWTYGDVIETCVDWDYPGDNDPDYPNTPVKLKCQTTADYGRHGGDSGAPVFRIEYNNDIRLFGLHVGTKSNGDAVFSSVPQLRNRFPQSLSFL